MHHGGNQSVGILISLARGMLFDVVNLRPSIPYQALKYMVFEPKGFMNRITAKGNP